ncbi:hypothetical protein ACFQ2K_38950 [Streptomyces sanglieri]|uniref:Uncharacterized protein n=1 Tax=Streptomyces sanglieri TaxID=193460 RepID=A0ABW2X1U4_9ACTN
MRRVSPSGVCAAPSAPRVPSTSLTSPAAAASSVTVTATSTSSASSGVSNSAISRTW